MITVLLARTGMTHKYESISGFYAAASSMLLPFDASLLSLVTTGQAGSLYDVSVTDNTDL